MTSANEQQRAHRGWMKYALILSLGLNLAVAGMIGGAYLGAWGAQNSRPGRDVSALGLRLYYVAMPAARQQMLKDEIKSRRGALQIGRKAMREHRKAVASALEADPFAATALEDVLKAQGDTILQNLSAGHALLVAQVAAMNAEERAEMARKLRMRRKSGGRR